MQTFGLMALVACLAWGHAATAATFNESDVQDIYRQASFGATPVDIRFGPVQEMVAPDFVELKGDAEFSALFATGGPRPAVNVFLVDDILVETALPGFPPVFQPANGITQFTQTGPIQPGDLEPPGIWGHNIAIDRDAASELGGANLIAHEIGHALGLSHEYGGYGPPTFNPNQLPDNLINPFASSHLLTPEQVALILLSPSIQWTPSDGYFVNVNLIDIVARPTAVPLPAGAWLLLTGLAGLISLRRGGREAAPRAL